MEEYIQEQVYLLKQMFQISAQPHYDMISKILSYGKIVIVVDVKTGKIIENKTVLSDELEKLKNIHLKAVDDMHTYTQVQIDRLLA